MRKNIVKFGREIGATLEVYVATFCIFCNFLATFRILHSNFSEIYEHNRSMPTRHRIVAHYKRFKVRRVSRPCLVDYD